jgi:hypothetical protein
MIDARVIGRNQQVKAKLDTEVGSLELSLNAAAPDVRLTPDEVYDLFTWLYNYHRDMLAFQMLRADLMAGEQEGAASEQGFDRYQRRARELENLAVCFLCEQEKRSTCELCKVPLCRFHQREVNGYFSLRRYIMCEGCFQHYQRFVGSKRL